MKHTTPRTRKQQPLPLAWRNAEYVALQVEAADACDDRVSRDMFDLEGEREEVNLVVPRDEPN